MEKSKYDQLIAEMDSTLWPIPGQEMQNAAVVKKAIPSLQSILNNPEDTDPQQIMTSAPPLGDPLQHSLVPFGELFEKIQVLRQLFERARTAPVYLGREEQQKTIEEVLQRLERVQKFIFKTVEKLDDLTIDSLNKSQ
jgi:hypothetical protein